MSLPSVNSLQFGPCPYSKEVKCLNIIEIHWDFGALFPWYALKISASVSQLLSRHLCRRVKIIHVIYEPKTQGC